MSSHWGLSDNTIQHVSDLIAKTLRILCLIFQVKANTKEPWVTQHSLLSPLIQQTISFCNSRVGALSNIITQRPVMNLISLQHLWPSTQSMLRFCTHEYIWRLSRLRILHCLYLHQTSIFRHASVGWFFMRVLHVKTHCCHCSVCTVSLSPV